MILSELALEIEHVQRDITLLRERLRMLRQEMREKLRSGVVLSRRQSEVLALIHLSNKEISARLHIAERTVKFHVSVLLEKYDVDSRYKLP